LKSENDKRRKKENKNSEISTVHAYNVYNMMLQTHIWIIYKRKENYYYTIHTHTHTHTHHVYVHKYMILYMCHYHNITWKTCVDCRHSDNDIGEKLQFVIRKREGDVVAWRVSLLTRRMKVTAIFRTCAIWALPKTYRQVYRQHAAK